MLTWTPDRNDTVLSSLHADVIRSHILTRLDGPTLASLSATSSHLRSLSLHSTRWEEICRATWPSTSSPRVQHVISSMQNRHRGFFAEAFALASGDWSVDRSRPSVPKELISAVDLRFRGDVILSKVVESDTSSGWFQHSPFRVDVLHRKEVVPTGVGFNGGDRDTCRDLMAGLELSWIVIDPGSNRAVNLSSFRPVSVDRHVLTKEAHVRFASVVPTGDSLVQFGVWVTCGGSHSGSMHVSEVCLVLEDLEGRHLKGRDSLVILGRVLRGKKGKGLGREIEGKKRYQVFLEKKNERKEMKKRNERFWDLTSVCLIIGGLVTLSIWVTMGR